MVVLAGQADPSGTPFEDTMPLVDQEPVPSAFLHQLRSWILSPHEVFQITAVEPPPPGFTTAAALQLGVQLMSVPVTAVSVPE
jgi:hypothetical protein